MAAEAFWSSVNPAQARLERLSRWRHQLAPRTAPFVFFSVERLVGLTSISDFGEELSLKNDLLDVLAAWPGVEPGIFIIDALDASRGGPSEAVIATLIELAVARLGERWSVVASIRTFDLLNGRRFREVMRGVPPNPGFAEADLKQVRHFRIPRFSVEELAGLANTAPASLNLSPPPR